MKKIKSIRFYNIRADEDANRKKLQIKMNKLDMRSFLKSQINDKKKLIEFEKSLDAEQLKLFQNDYQHYLSHETDINMKVNFELFQLKFNNLTYQDYLKMQIEERKGKKTEKMNDDEYCLNRNLLEDIKITSTIK